MTLLNVRETAGLLGVHPNTVRNWELRGFIHAARRVGVRRFRRFEEDEVFRVLALMEGPGHP